MDAKDIKIEHDYLKFVLNLIEEQLNGLMYKKSVIKSDVQEGMSLLWGEGSHIIRDFDDVIQLSVQNQEIVYVEERYAENEREIAKLKKMCDSPYFARIDLIIARETEAKIIYIGTHHIRNEENSQICVCDWRAPICSVFYDFDLGVGWYDTVGGRNEINMVLKRQFKILKGEMIYLYDTDSSMPDDILGEILSDNTNNRLKVIVSSIQKEQNIAIRTTQTKPLLIYGLAGTGKTSVGLHRLAYLLYHQKKVLKAENIVVLSNNTVFDSYISNIIPDLGEQNVTHLIFYNLLESIISYEFRIETPFNQQKELEISPFSERATHIRLKYSYNLIQFCISYFNEYSFVFPNIQYKDNTIVDARTFNENWNERRCPSFMANYKRIQEMIKQYYEDFFLFSKNEILQDLQEESEDFLFNDELERALSRFKRQCISETTQDFIHANEVNPSLQMVEIFRLYSEGVHFTEVVSNDLELSILSGHVKYEDALFYLLVSLLMGTISSKHDVLQVLIDEAQDWSLLQLYIVQLLYPKSSFTLLADVNQAIQPITTIQNYKDFELIFGSDMQKIMLTKSYRSSGPINALAFQLIHNNKVSLSHTSFFQRSGKMPNYIVSQKPMRIIHNIINCLELYNLVGIVTYNTQDAIAIYESLKDNEDVQIIIKDVEEMEKKIIIMPLLLAKGLEFDTVLAINCFQDSGDFEYDRRKAYLVSTRALHELYIIENENLPKIFSDCEPFLQTDNM